MMRCLFSEGCGSADSSGAARFAAALTVLLALSACDRLAVPDVAPGAKPTRAMVENRVWLAQDADQAPGSFLAFISDGTLVMDSCHETWRLAPWRWVQESILVWEEDTATVRAEVVLVEPDELILLLEPDTLNLTRTYAAARPPVLCNG